MSIQMKLQFQQWLRALSREDFKYTLRFLRAMSKDSKLQELELVETKDKLELAEAELQYRMSLRAA